MPTYSFICNESLDGCGCKFEISMSIKEYERLTFYYNAIKCPTCSKTEFICRNYARDIPITFVKLGDDEIKLGHLAKRNTDKMSKDEKKHLNYEHNKYKYETPKDIEKKLPKGAKYIGPKNLE